VVVTDLEPVSADRLRAQLELIGELNATLAPFRILSGIEVDVLEDGSLDQAEELLGQLDVVVASVHSKLRMESKPMTQRMIAAVRNPHTNVLGHCAGRIITGRGRPQSEFDAEAVFTAYRESGVAVEVNCRPDVHAPGQLDWLDGGSNRHSEPLYGLTEATCRLVKQGRFSRDGVPLRAMRESCPTLFRRIQFSRPCRLPG
jgi:putative hydrolase